MESTRRDAGNLRDRLRRALPAAIKAQDTVAVAALRSALAAIDNTEAVDPDAATSRPVDPEAEIAGSVAGVGAGDTAPWRLRASSTNRRDASSAPLTHL